jgi:hypothetical protein
MKYLTLLFAALLAMSQALANPGAHGPNGEHLDGPSGASSSGSSLPQLETFTEAFELVGRLSGGELSIMIDRYETNEPVLNGNLEVQYKNLKAKARFHADLGDYSIDDPRFLKAISAPGSHPLLFTFVAGEESDLLEGTLQVSPPANENPDDHLHDRPWLTAMIVIAVLLAAAFIVRARRQRKGY